MTRKKLLVMATSIVLTFGLFASVAAQEKHQMAVHVTGAGGAANTAINTALGRPIESAFTNSGRFAADRNREFSSAARRADANAQIIAAANESGVRFVCVIDASNVRAAPGVPPRLSGSASIRLLDAALGREVGAPQTVNMPPSDAPAVAQALVTLAISAAADVVAAGPQSSPTASGATTSGNDAFTGITLDNHRFEDEEPVAGGATGNAAFGESQFAATQTVPSTSTARPARVPRERAQSQNEDSRITGGGGSRNAQNARVMSQGGFYIDDASIIGNYAAAIVGMQNMAQVTWANGGFGQILAIKNLNETMTLGVLANTPHPAFNVMGYDGAGSSDIPQILLGFDLDAFKLGAELSVIWTREFAINDVSGSSSVDTKYRDWFFFPTIRLSALFDLGDMELLSRLGIGFLMGSEKYTDNNNSSDNSETKHEDVLFVDMGAELTMPFMDAELTVGASWTFISDKSASGNVADVTESNSVIAAYAELGYEVLENANLIVGYHLERRASKTRIEGRGTASTDSKDVLAEYVHTLSAGLEHIWDDVRFFDNVALRGGAYYQISNVRNTLHVDAPDSERRDRSKNETDYEQVIPTFGLGASKGAFSLDLFLALENWNNSGALAGPPVGAATITVRF